MRYIYFEYIILKLKGNFPKFREKNTGSMRVYEVIRIYYKITEMREKFFWCIFLNNKKYPAIILHLNGQNSLVGTKGILFRVFH